MKLPEINLKLNEASKSKKYLKKLKATYLQRRA